MFPNPLPLQVNGAGDVLNYDLGSTGDGSSLYRDHVPSYSTPHTVKISHSTSNPGKSNQVTRHLVRVDWTALDVTGTPTITSAYVVIVAPLNNGNVNPNSVLGVLADFLQQTDYQSKIINSEI